MISLGTRPMVFLLAACFILVSVAFAYMKPWPHMSGRGNEPMGKHRQVGRYGENMGSDYPSLPPVKQPMGSFLETSPERLWARIPGERTSNRSMAEPASMRRRTENWPSGSVAPAGFGEGRIFATAPAPLTFPNILQTWPEEQVFFVYPGTDSDPDSGGGGSDPSGNQGNEGSGAEVPLAGSFWMLGSGLGFFISLRLLDFRGR